MCTPCEKPGQPSRGESWPSRPQLPSPAGLIAHNYPPLLAILWWPSLTTWGWPSCKHIEALGRRSMRRGRSAPWGSTPWPSPASTGRRWWRRSSPGPTSAAAMCTATTTGATAVTRRPTSGSVPCAGLWAPTCLCGSAVRQDFTWTQDRQHTRSPLWTRVLGEVCEVLVSDPAAARNSRVSCRLPLLCHAAGRGAELHQI
ncbi:hypothetical protein QTO34_019910, partial [Cnephaeus nilssonii]